MNPDTATIGRPDEVLRFWFGEPPGKRRKAWFEKNPAFDADMRTRFLRLHSRAVCGELKDWTETRLGALALIVLTDQFSRNMFRGTPHAFASDALALATARQLLAAGSDAQMRPVERQFAYLPFEHSEALADQERALTLFAPLGAHVETADTPEYARRHWEIVKRFGRFPHRNAILDRVSTPEEIEFLTQPGSGF